jgi:hypothetical protein
MTEQISTITPNLYTAGIYIQDNVLKGYRLVEGYPTTYGWQYEVVMELVAEAPKKPGRPFKS